VTDEGTWKGFFKGRDALVEQATRQVTAAAGRPVEWHVAEKKAADAMQELLQNADPLTRRNILVRHVPEESM
jgi:hypothetical protein